MISNLLIALQKGYILRNATAWKNAGTATAAVTALLAALSGIAVHLGWLETVIPVEVLAQVSAALVTLVGFFLGYVNVATSTKVGTAGTHTPNARRMPNVQTGAEYYADQERTGVKSSGDTGRATWLGG